MASNEKGEPIENKNTVFFTDHTPFLQPTNSVRALKAKRNTSYFKEYSIELGSAYNHNPDPGSLLGVLASEG